ncbi:MAG: G5 domain-containing protein [Anaerococcus hydrogenalis]|uniref:G5 domain-containing protein n=1 Tax=Anaerococcus hydrogenalis TaxID=33029 RepID=UPI00291336B8|nr:G5 domain-containing protein [Anaerococcus hydrogenalis]MDU3687228.1 G5 domain-containing protein [Anaerococcus hydrogenalis]
MNKKKDIIALALSVSFVMGGASLSHADEINPDTTSYISEKQPSENENKSINQIEDKENEDVTEVVNNSNTNEVQNLELSEEKTPDSQGAGQTDGQPAEENQAQETNEPNYSEDEKKIKDYSGEERYRSTQMEQGDGTDAKYVPPDEKGNFIDGYRYHSSEPSAASEDKTQWGIEIEIDKEKGQRTYTDFYFTNSGLLGGVLDTGNVSANDEDEKIAGGEKDPNYKATSEIEISGSRNQRNLNLYASEEDLKHINNKDNTNTTMAWQGKYLKDNPNGLKATEGSNATFSFTVNPWPNENDNLQLMKLNGEYNEKVFVQGQDINTGVKVDNIDDSAKERLVGQVYNPITGEIVPGSRAYIGEDGNIHIQMPNGALKKDETGKYVVDEESIFSTEAYKGLQSLDVKFFARPRTKAEFEAAIPKLVDDETGEVLETYGIYTETGAGTETINHNGKNVVIDKQGIDRYDHYNLIGNFKLQLDDTRYYTQKFIDQNNEETDDHKFSRVFPGDDFEVKINDPTVEETDKTRKTVLEMDAAYKAGQASGKLNDEFLEVANRQISENLGVDYNEFISNDAYKDNRWSIDGSADNISHFKIHAPKNAKAGDFLAVPVEYTYTNGSTDTHWFHFVVQETNNNRPEYLAEVGPQGNTLVNNPIVPKKDEDLKKNQPESYELIGNTFKDNKGHIWNVIIDQSTGAVTATLPLNENIQGGEKLTVPVRVKYTDKDTGKEKTEEIKAQFIATKQYKSQTSEKLTSKIPFETKVEYDPNLPEGYFQEFQAGQNGELTTTFIQDTLNGKKGLFQTDGTFIEGDRKIEATVTREATPRIIKIGTMPTSTTIEIPFDTEYEVDETLAAGETKIVNDGEKGEVTITTSREEDGTVKINKETTKEAKNKKIKIGTMTKGEIVDKDKIPFKYKVEFDKDFYKNYPDATENYKIVTPGKEGENTKTWTIVNSEKVGDPKIEITDPVDAVIKVGQKDYNGTVTNTVTKEIPYTVRVVKNPDLEAGKSNVKQKGVAGSRTYEYSGEIVNGDLKEGITFIEKELTDKYVEPKEEIIEIGTKPAENSKTINSDVEVDVNIIYDPSVDKGVVNIGDLKPGTVTTVVKNEYDPETGEIKTTEETVVTKPSRTVVIGTKDFSSSYTEVDNKVTPYKTEIQFDDTLKKGEQETVQIGVDGVVTTETEVTIVNGQPKKGDPKVTYSHEVQNQIIKVGTMTEGKHSHEEKIPFKYEIEYDSNLKAGEYVVDVEGKEGSRTTEWTIKNSEVVKDSANVTKEEAPTNAKIRVGNKDFVGNISHEVTEEIPYDVKIVEDPTMIAGTSEVVTEGKTGSKTTKYTQAIKNGEAEGKIQSEVTAETNPTQQVIKIGTKPAENNKDYSKEVGVKVEYVYDSSLKMGVFKDGGLTNGKVETKIVNKYDPATGKITTTEEEVVTEAVQKIIVGTQDFTGKYPYESTTEIPFKVIIKEDPNLAKGQSRVEQEGKAGSKTTYYEISIKNGEKVGDPIITNEVENDQPLDHIIYVGTAVAKSSTVETLEKDIPYETKITYDENLDAGSQVVDEEGVIGKEKVTITTDITDGTGETSKTTETIKDKVDREVRIGTKPVTKVVEKPFNTEYQYDENLEVGKTEEVTPGKNGKVTITTSYDKDQKKVVTSETEEAGQNRVVKIGGKTNGTEKVKEEIPFDVEVRKDTSLKKGEWKYATDDEGNELKGEKGEQEKTITIENSKVTNTSEPTVTKKAKNAVILVGEGTNDGTHEIKEKKELLFETRYEYDENLEAGQREETGGTTGEQERTNTLVIKDGKVEETKEGEFKTTKDPVDKVIKIGIKPILKEVEKPFETEYIYDENVEMGKEEEVTPGEKGKVTITTSYDKDQNKLVTKEETKDPVKRVVKVGIKPVIKEEPIPHVTEYKHNPELKAGETKKIKDGTSGKIIVTTTFNKETGKIETIVERTEPTKAVYEYGSKTDGNVKVEGDLPFEVEIIKDPGMEAGKTETVQEGKLGKKETTITVENSKEVSREEKVITDPVKKIVKIGTKNVCEIPSVKPTEGETKKTIEREIPYETKVIYDETLESGTQKIENEGKAGKEEVTITQKVKDSKPVGDPTETIKTIIEKEDRVVRIGVKPVVKETELGHDTEYRYNPELKEGEQETIEEGFKGFVKYTTTFNKEIGKLEVKEERVEPKNKVVEYGSKTDGEFTYESEKAYDIMIRENSDLEAGKTNVIQEGKPGKTETTVKIENSKEVSRDTKTITEKQDKIIEIGTKNVCEIPPVTPGEDDPKDPEKPGEDDPKDPEKPGEDDPKDPGKPGEENPKDPEKPGEENPKDTGKLGEKDLTKSGQTSETPQKPKDKKDKKINPSRKLEKTKIVSNKENANKNPSTGVSSLSIVLSSLGISLGALGFSKKKRKNK